MSFKLTIEIKDDTTTDINFDGTINHVVLLGVLESVKHGILGTVEMMSAQQALSAIEGDNIEGGQQETAPPASE